MSSRFSLVLFDMEGVLTHYDRNERVVHLAAETGRDAAAIRHAFWDSGLEARADAGEISEDEYLRLLGDMLCYPLSREQWLASRRASITPNAKTLALAEQVHKQCRIAILTNNCGLVTHHLDYLNPPVAALFGDAVHSSATFGATKPAAQAYLGCVERIGVPPGDTLFIDDTEANVQGAIDAGLAGYRFVDAESLARSLAQHGLL